MGTAGRKSACGWKKRTDQILVAMYEFYQDSLHRIVTLLKSSFK